LGPKLEEHVGHFCAPDAYAVLLFHLKTDYNDARCGDVTAKPTVDLPSSTSISRMLVTEENQIPPLAHAAEQVPLAPGPVLTCGPVCKTRVRQIHLMGGCPTLRFLCTNHKHANHSEADEDSHVLTRFTEYLRTLIFALIAYGSFLILSTACTCAFIYTLGTGRQGKKGAHALCLRVLCPCWKNKRTSHQKLRREDRVDFEVE